MTELDYILQNFDERFRRFKGRRIALYPGKYLGEITRRFDSDYRFHYVLEPDASEVPKDADLVILTDCRRKNEPDYNAVRESCEKQGTPLLDVYGVDMIETRRELVEQKHLTIAQWKELLAEYDVVSLSMANLVADFVATKERWILRRRFLILYRWLKSQGKTVLFLWENQDQIDSLIREGIEVEGGSLENEEAGAYFLRLTEQYPGRKIFHVGRDVARDGLIPRGYGLDSRLLRYFVFQFKVSTADKGANFHVDRDRLLEEIDRCDVVSFDVFDTLIKRTVLRPDDIFEIVEEKTGVKGFAEARIYIQKTSPRLTLDEMYDWLKVNCGYDDQTTETLRQTELQTETDVILPRDSMTEIFEYAKSRNKPIALVSDMYLDPVFMRELLEKNGIAGYQALIISNEFRIFKHEGLFEELRELRKNGEKVLHIGDNHFSDYTAAKNYGLDAFYVPSCLETAKQNGYANVLEMQLSLTERKILGLGVALGFDDPFAPSDDLRIANMIVAPLVVGYLLWVVGELKGKGYDYFLFSSRDGWILQDVYDRLRRLLPEQLPPGKYFYSNRRAAILTVMDNFKLLNYFFTLPYKDDPPKLLRRLFRIPEENLLPYGGESAKDYYYMHEETIREEAEQYRENYRNYLAREGLTGKKCAIMDFVSEGNAQMMLERSVVKMDGYYVGIPNHVSKYDENIRYFLDHDLISFDTLMKVEGYFTSPEPALDYIGADGTPILAEEVRTRNVMDRIQRIHEYARRYFDEFFERLYRGGRFEETTDKELFFSLCASINQYDVENFYYDDMIKQNMPTGR